MPDPENETPQPEPSAEQAPERGTVVDASADFIQLVVDYVRQETGDVVKDKVVLPTQKAGTVVAFAMAAASVLFLGIAFIAVAALLVLAELVGWPAALTIVGVALIAGAAGFSYAKMKRMEQ